MLVLAFLILCLRGFKGNWPIAYFRYILLLASSIFHKNFLFCFFTIYVYKVIPISLRVNLDFAKAIFSYKINTDKFMPGTIARNSNIPEELG